MKTIDEIMIQFNLTGHIIEPAPYYYERVKLAMQEFANQEIEKAHDEWWESEYGTGDNKGIPLTSEETKKMWDELPKRMLEKYSDENWDAILNHLQNDKI